jgi:hypothetical protein
VLSVAATGSGLAYRWSRDGADLSDDARITGTATPTLGINPVTIEDRGRYRVRVTGCGSSVTSNPALLRVVCTADFNSDGFLDFFDFDDFVLCFGESNCPPSRTADFNADGFIDFFDFDDFVAAFERGC